MANGNFGGGNGTAGTPYLIEDAGDLNAVRNNLTANYKLVNHINLGVSPYNTGSGWTPIQGNFTGSLDGNGKTIVNMTINTPSSNDIGLFAMFGGVIKDLGFLKCNVIGLGRVGLIGGRVTALPSNITRVSAKGCNVSGNASDVGGFFGIFSTSAATPAAINTGFTILNWIFQGTVKTTTGSVSGFIGRHFNSSANAVIINSSMVAATITGGTVLNATMHNAIANTYTNTNSFYDSTLFSGSGPGATATTTTNLKIASTFSTWSNLTISGASDTSVNGQKVYLIKDGSYPIIYFEIYNKIFVLTNGTDYRIWNGTAWISKYTSQPSSQEFKTDGMLDISVIPQSAWDLLKTYTSVELVNLINEMSSKIIDATIPWNTDFIYSYDNYTTPAILKSGLTNHFITQPTNDGNWTVEFDIYIASATASTAYYLFDSGAQTSSQGVSISYQAGARHINFKTATRYYFLSGVEMPLDVWFNLALTYDGTTLKYYVNGILKTSITTFTTITQNSSSGMIAILRPIDTASYSGQSIIKNALVIDKCLSQAEIQENTNSNGTSMIYLVTKTFTEHKTLVVRVNNPWIALTTQYGAETLTTAVPSAKLIRANGDINLTNVVNIDNFTLTNTTSGNGVIKLIASADSGTTWRTWDATIPWSTDFVYSYSNYANPAILRSGLTNHFITQPTNSGLWTVKFDVYIPSSTASTAEFLFSTGAQTTSQGLAISYALGSKTVVFKTADRQYNLSAVDMPVDIWFNIAVTYDGVTLRYYTNGSLKASTITYSTITQSTSAGSIAILRPTHVDSNYGKSTIKNLLVIDKCLSEAEIRENTNSNGTSIIYLVTKTFTQHKTLINQINNPWSLIDITNLSDVKTKGVTPTILNTITHNQWQKLLNNSTTLRFGYYLEQDATTDSARTDLLTMQADISGYWKRASHGTDYDYQFPSSSKVQFSLYSDGTYKINYYNS